MSVFRNCEPAAIEQIMPIIYRLAPNFPAMNTTYTVGDERISFWTVLCEQVAALGWSVERTKYAVENILRNCKYREFRVAEFLQLDKNVQTISQEDFAAIERSRMPHKPIVSAELNGNHVLLWLADAEQAGLPYRRRWTTWEAEQMTAEQRKENGIKWLD